MDKITDYKPDLEATKSFTPEQVPGVNAPLFNIPMGGKNNTTVQTIIKSTTNTETFTLARPPISIDLWAKNSFGTVFSLAKWTPESFSRMTWWRSSPMTIDENAISSESFTVDRNTLTVINPNGVTLTFYITL